MGNRTSGISARLERAIETDTIWADMVADPHSRAINFSDQSVRESHYDRQTFEAEVMATVPSNLDLAAVFPSLTLEGGQRVIRASRYRRLDRFNRELNARLHRHQTAVQVAFCWADYIYRVSGVSGNLYLTWARELSIYHPDDPEIDKVGRDLPLLVATDGHFRTVAYYPLIAGDSTFEILFMPAASTACSYPRDFAIYPCDTPEPEPVARPIATLDSEEARMRRERVVKPPGEQPVAVSPGRWVHDPGHRYCTSDNPALVSDEVAEFFLSAVEDDPLERQALGDVSRASVSTYISSDAEILCAASDDENDQSRSSAAASSSFYIHPPTTARLRNAVPRSLLPRNQHRTGRRLVHYSPRQINISPLTSSRECTSDVEEAAMPDGVTRLDLAQVAVSLDT